MRVIAEGLGDLAPNSGACNGGRVNIQIRCSGDAYATKTLKLLATYVLRYARRTCRFFLYKCYMKGCVKKTVYKTNIEERKGLCGHGKIPHTMNMSQDMTRPYHLRLTSVFREGWHCLLVLMREFLHNAFLQQFPGAFYNRVRMKFKTNCKWTVGICLKLCSQ